MQIAFNKSATFRRDDEMLQQGFAGLGFTVEQVALRVPRGFKAYDTKNQHSTEKEATAEATKIKSSTD